jgi:glycosyltransferase involved in cell wall biosynthesis
MRIGLLAPVYERVPPLLHGGTERTVALLAEGLQARGHSVTVFASADSQVGASLVAPMKRALRYSDPLMDPTSATLLHIAEAYERTSELDLMHNLAGPLAFPFARLSSIPTVSSVFDRLDRPGVDRIYENFAEQPLVATSWAQRARLPGADWRATIHGAVDIRQFRFRASPGDYLVYVGRVGPEKRLEWAIDLAREVDRKLVIAGWVAPEDEDYFNYVLAPRIRSAPHVEDLAEIEDWEKDALLGGAFAFVYAGSDPGASGLPLLEAMATGTPVVAAAASPASELVRDYVTGFLCESLGDMAAAIDAIPKLNRKAARTHVARRFSPAALARMYEQVYEDLFEDRQDTADVLSGRHLQDHHPGISGNGAVALAG